MPSSPPVPRGIGRESGQNFDRTSTRKRRRRRSSWSRPNTRNTRPRSRKWPGTPRPRPTGESEQVPVDLLFKAIGYRGEPVPGVPFEDRKGIVPNEAGRVVEELGGAVRVGHYAAGWCKRGPTGLIGTNSLDAKDTVVGMLADYEAQNLISPNKDDIAGLLAERSIDAVTWADWQRLDAWERKEGESRGKLRHKLTSIEELMTVIAELRTK